MLPLPMGFFNNTLINPMTVSPKTGIRRNQTNTIICWMFQVFAMVSLPAIQVSMEPGLLPAPISQSIQPMARCSTGLVYS
jgi:hypothetical protein